MLYLYYCDSGRKHMFCENVMHERKLRHVEFLRHQPHGTNDSLLLGNIKNVTKLPYILSVLQSWKTTDIKTGWWQGKWRDFFVSSSAWRERSTWEEENQHCCYSCGYKTGRFVMFSVITNIYKRKTKWPTLMELFTATVKLKKFFLTTIDVRYVHHGWHGTHRYDIQVLATHASTRVHRYSSLLQWSVALIQRGHMAMEERILCTKCMLHSNHKLTRVIFQRTKRFLPRSGHFLTTYTRIA